MSISVIDPIPRALAYTKHVLFQPFDLGKWFVMGFTAFLAMLDDGVGGGGGGFNIPTGHGRGRGGGGDHVMAFIADHIVLICGIAAVAIVVLLALTALLLWIGCRGRFMFLDNVAHNRAEVVEPWKRFRRLGNSLWTLRFAVALLMLVLTLGAVAGGVALAWRDIVDHVFGSAALRGIIVGGAAIVLFALCAWIFQVFVGDFIVPVMYVRNSSAWVALRIFVAELLWPHVGKFVLCFLLMFAINTIIVLMLIVVGVLTCCIACCIVGIPYIGVVVLLPLIVYDRAYTLYFLEQFGPQWRVIQPVPEAVTVV